MIVSAHGIQLPPKSFEPQRAARTFNGLAERGYVPSPADLPLLEALFGNSAYLARVALRNATFLKALFSRGVAACFDETCGEAAAAEHATTLKDVMAMLRAAKARAALSVGLADISGKWPLEAVTAALTRFADISTGAALRFLLNQAAAQARPEISSSSEDLERASGLVVLALGKFGGEELNYSSDIDLIVFYDPARFPFRKRGDARGAAVDIVKGLVRLLSEITADGYVFRVDLRLRPDAGATQIAISTDAAQAYYENMGQNWERAALIKARPCAGDLDAARTLLRNLEPFVWRRTLDYAAIDDIHSIKRQIHAHAGHDKLAVAGHDIKVGRGGIREIEFFVQTQQLILGGRDRSLRPRSTLAALKALEARGLVDAQTASNLATAYIFLRTLEHRLQMIEDQQTHTIPSEEEGLKHIACFMGFGSVALFSDAVLAHLGTVQQHYGRLFERAPPLASSAGSLVFTGVENDRETLRTLHRLGFSDPDHVAQAVRGWHHGRVRATRGPRARELLTKLVPALLNALASSADPDGAFSQFDRFLSRLPTGVQLFSMLLANPHLLKLLADICGVAPRFAGALGRSPRLLDALLDADFLLAAPDYATLSRLLASDLEQASSYELKLDAVRRFAGEQVFRTAVHMMEGLASGEKGAQAFTSIAEAVISNTLPMVENEFRRSFGGIEGGAFAVIVLGRLGGREMTASSDLDLVFVYDSPMGVQCSDGPKPLPASTYFSRLAQRLISALTAHTAEGGLYEVDMRLRPTGNKGPVAVSLESFDRYHAAEAWTWERMALTRARVLCGAPGLCDKAERILRRTLVTARDADALKRDVGEMRQTVGASFPAHSHWDLKYASGALVDIEFVTQYLQLREAHRNPSVLDVNTIAALEKLHAYGALDQVSFTALNDGARLQHTLLQFLRIAAGDKFDAASAPRGLKHLLTRAVGEIDFPRLEQRLRAVQAAAHTVFQQLIAV